ncbi:MAG: hypothetical protein ACYS8W_02810 [Planctomycetota bacterium]|jgi:hypothetical protein
MTPKRVILILIGAAILGYLVYSGISCLITTEEDRIRRMLDDCRDVIESGSAFKATDIKEYLTDDFNCKAGFARDAIPGFLVGTWQQGGKPVIVLSGHEFNIEGDKANVCFRLDATFPSGMIKGDHAFDMKLECRKVEGEWKISNADWDTLEGIDPAEH